MTLRMRLFVIALCAATSLSYAQTPTWSADVASIVYS